MLHCFVFPPCPLFWHLGNAYSSNFLWHSEGLRNSWRCSNYSSSEFLIGQKGPQVSRQCPRPFYRKEDMYVCVCVCVCAHTHVRVPPRQVWALFTQLPVCLFFFVPGFHLKLLQILFGIKLDLRNVSPKLHYLEWNRILMKKTHKTRFSGFTATHSVAALMPHSPIN